MPHGNWIVPHFLFGSGAVVPCCARGNNKTMRTNRRHTGFFINFSFHGNLLTIFFFQTFYNSLRGENIGHDASFALSNNSYCNGRRGLFATTF
jgi:hypothetical protein